MTSRYQVKIYPTSYGFNQYLNYTDFDFKLDGFIRIFGRPNHKPRKFKNCFWENREKQYQCLYS